MNPTTEKINQIKKNGYTLDFGEIFNDTFENYKKTALLMGAVFLLLTIIYIVLTFGIMGFFIGVGSYTDFLTGSKTFAELSTFNLIIQSIFKIFIAGLVAPITAGFIKMAHNAEIGDDFGINTAFEYYKTKYFKDLFIASVLISAVISIFEMASNLLFFKDLSNIKNIQNFNFGNIWLASVITIIFVFIIVILTIFTTPLIIFGDLTATEAIQQSFLLAFKNFWMILLLLLVAFICCLIGLIGICIGVLFTIIQWFISFTKTQSALIIPAN
jgi:hypothetical protein